MENETNNALIESLASGLGLISEYGWLYVIGGLLIIAAVVNYKKFFDWLANLPNWMANLATSSAKSVIYEERIAQLERDQEKERIHCDEKMNEMRRDYEDKISKLETKMDAMQELIIKQSVHIARIEEQLKASQETAQKFYRKSGSSVKPKDE